MAVVLTGASGVYARRHETRWKMRLDHVSDDLPYGFRGVLDVREYSDEQFQQDYERAFSLSAARQTISRGFLTKNFGDHSVNLRVERNETFFSREVVQMRLPSLDIHRVEPESGSVLRRGRIEQRAIVEQRRIADLGVVVRHALRLAAV